MCIIALVAIVGGAKAQTDGGFSAFYKQQQTRLLQHIDTVIGKKAEYTLTDNFTFIRNAGVHLQSGLGERKSGAGVDLIGALSATDNRAVGWQLRGYVNEDDIKGANVGLFFRQNQNNVLFGINTFADYEDGEYGAFSRYGFGGEVQGEFFAVNANYYKPITDDKKINATVAAFSREGYDANLRLYLPNYNFLKLRGNYYNYDGKGNTKKDEGFRYGLELSPIKPVRFALYYDDNAKKLGGDIAIHFPFDKTQPQQNNNTTYTPDLFAPITREYSQRIMTVATGPAISLQLIPTLTVTNAVMTTSQTTTTTITIVAMTIETAQTSLMLTPPTSREASVLITTREDLSGGQFVLVTTSSPILLTLPAVTTPRPWVIRLEQRNLGAEIPVNNAIVISATFEVFVGNGHALRNAPRTWIVTIVQGSERLTNPSVTITITTGTLTTTTPQSISLSVTTMPITIFQTLTSFQTNTITLTQNAALPPAPDNNKPKPRRGGM